MELFHIIIIGILSCFAMDLWQRILKLLFGINPSDWSVVGRWFVLLISKGKIYSPNIDNEAVIKNELSIGWLVHYGVAIMYSGAFFMLIKQEIFIASYAVLRSMPVFFATVKASPTETKFTEAR